MDQYEAYFNCFGTCPAIKPDNRGVKGIGGRQNSQGCVKIQIPFNELAVVIDVDFTLLNGDSPCLLCTRDLILNGLDISLKERTMSFQNGVQSVELENYFLIHRWGPEDLP